MKEEFKKAMDQGKGVAYTRDSNTGKLVGRIMSDEELLASDARFSRDFTEDFKKKSWFRREGAAPEPKTIK